MMAFQSTQEHMIYELSTLYDAERRFLDAQQMMLREATDPQLQEGLRMHIGQSEQQLNNLDQVFKELGQQLTIITNIGAQGLVTAGEQALQEAGNEALRNCVICGNIARVEHFEIACYNGLVTAAQGMGRQQVVTLLRQNLQQEQQTAQQAEQLAPHLLRVAMQAEGTQPKGTTDAATGKEAGARAEAGLSVDIGTSVEAGKLLRQME